MAIFYTEGLSHCYEGSLIIEDINISAEQGELVAIIGESGTGKSTLFNVIAGLERPETGRVMLKGEDITAKPGHVSYMFQKDLLLPHMSLLDNLMLPLKIQAQRQGKSKRHLDTTQARSLLADFGLAGYEKAYPSQLSGGMRQRAAILRTYLYADALALMDEPFSALDALTKQKAHRWYLEVQQKLSLTTLMITHDIDEAILLADKIYIMGGHPGKIIWQSTDHRPSKDYDYALTPAFLEKKRDILSRLKTT